VKRRHGDLRYRPMGIVINTPNAPRQTMLRANEIGSNLGMRFAVITQPKNTSASSNPVNRPVRTAPPWKARAGRRKFVRPTFMAEELLPFRPQTSLRSPVRLRGFRSRHGQRP